MPPTKACNSHADQTLEIQQVLDAQLYWTDALLRCQACGQYLLGELIDMQAGERLYRLTAVSQAGAQAVLRSIETGSCDLQRAQTELDYLDNTGQLCDEVLLVEGDQQQTCTWPSGLSLPSASWRELACDGALLDALKRAHSIRS